MGFPEKKLWNFHQVSYISYTIWTPYPSNKLNLKKQCYTNSTEMTTELVSLQILRTLVVTNSVNKHTQQNVTSQQKQKQSHSNLVTIVVIIFYCKQRRDQLFWRANFYSASA